MPERVVTAAKAARAEMALTAATEAPSLLFILRTITSNTLLRTLMAVIRDNRGQGDLADRLVSPARPELAEIPARRCVGNTASAAKAGHRKDLAVREDPGSLVPPEREELTELPVLHRPNSEAAVGTAEAEAPAAIPTTGFSTYPTTVARHGSYTIHGTPDVGKFTFKTIIRTGRT